MRIVNIDPITRLEGHGKVSIFLDDAGNVENAYLQVPEFRGFEKFCEGRPAEEVARITTRICGVCPWAHHMASTKCLDDLYKVEPPATAKKLREMAFNIYQFYDRIINFYFLAAPDFVVGPSAPPAERNVLGLINKVGIETGTKVISVYKESQELLQLLGGRTIHPVWGIPGGVSRGITDEQRIMIAEKCRGFIEFAKFTLGVFHDIVLKDKDYLDLIVGDVYRMNSYYMGMVDENNKVNLYDGYLRVVSPNGKEFARFHPSEYLDHIAEEVLPWTYLKTPYLKKIGWKGITDGEDSGLFRVAPLARLNASEGMATPLADEEYKRMFETLGKPAHATLAFHWARLIELLYSAERALELAEDPQTAGGDVRNIPSATPKEGIGVVEAPRGTLFHHYWSDENGIITKINLIVATGNNYGAMNYSIKKAAEKLIRNGDVKEGLLNMVEMAFRAYDPCLACATHTLPGQMPLEIEVFGAGGEIVQRLRQG